jgi:hypothetical protein
MLSIPAHWVRRFGVSFLLLLESSRSLLVVETAVAIVNPSFGFVDLDLTMVDHFTVESDDGRLAFGPVGHFDKTESFGTAGVAVGHDFDAFDLTTRPEKVLQFSFGDIMG